MDGSTITHLINYKNWKIEVLGKKSGEGCVTPLSFKVFYDGECINGKLTDKQVKSIEDGIHSFFKNKLN